jgi:uncharacterized membrane protein
VSLSFSNSTPGRISLVYAHPTSGCGTAADPWMKEGWWIIPPGGRVTVQSGSVGATKFLYFAEDGTGRTWAGEFSTSVPHEAFTQCWNISTPGSRQVSMRKFDVPFGAQDHNVNLTI